MKPIKISGDFNELLTYVESVGFGIKREDYPLTSLFLYAVLVRGVCTNGGIIILENENFIHKFKN